MNTYTQTNSKCTYVAMVLIFDVQWRRTYVIGLAFWVEHTTIRYTDKTQHTTQEPNKKSG